MTRRTGAVLALALAALASGRLAGCGRTTPPPVTFSAKDADFRAVFPVTPKRLVKTATPSGASVDVITYEAATNGEDIGVVFTHSATAPAAGDVQKALDAAMDAEAVDFSGSVSSRVTATVAGHPAEDAVITRSGASFRSRAVFRDNRFYVLFGGTSKPEDPHPNYDRMLQTFQWAS
ncbi:MAG: hypothetical protein JWM17_1851 [Actinobacteria bacterium]|jgi:hypothetical protein|nr:hypothetical protein [Actinomycetota bacterium]